MNESDSTAISLSTAEQITVHQDMSPSFNHNVAICQPILVHFKDDILTHNVWLKISFGIFYVTIFLLGVLGNSAVIYITLVNHQLRTVQNIFILNMTVADVVTCLISLPITPVFLMYKEWYFGRILCHLIPWMQATSVLISALMLVAIAIDRYILIVLPHSRPITNRFAITVVAVTSLVCALVSAPYAYFMQYQQYATICGYFCDEAWPTELTKQSFSAIVVVLDFVIPAIIMAVCYGRVLSTLRHHVMKKLCRQQKTTADTSKVEMLKRKQQTTIVLVAMVVLFGICWLPQTLMMLVHDFMGSKLEEVIKDYLYLIYLITHSLSSLTLLTNPLLYAWLNRSFREILLRTLAIPSVTSFDNRHVTEANSRLMGRGVTTTFTGLANAHLPIRRLNAATRSAAAALCPSSAGTTAVDAESRSSNDPYCARSELRTGSSSCVDENNSETMKTQHSLAASSSTGLLVSKTTTAMNLPETVLVTHGRSKVLHYNSIDEDDTATMCSVRSHSLLTNTDTEAEYGQHVIASLGKFHCTRSKTHYTFQNSALTTPPATTANIQKRLWAKTKHYSTSNCNITQYCEEKPEERSNALGKQSWRAKFVQTLFIRDCKVTRSSNDLQQFQTTEPDDSDCML